MLKWGATKWLERRGSCGYESRKVQPLAVHLCSRKSFVCSGSMCCRLSQELGCSHPHTRQQSQKAEVLTQKSSTGCPGCVMPSSSFQWAIQSSYVFLENIDYSVLQIFFHQAYLSLSDSVRMIKDLSFEIGYFCTEKKKNRSILRGLWLTGMKLLLYPVLYMSRVAELRITFEKCWSDLGLMFDSWKWLELPMTLYASALHLQSSLEVISNDNQWK